MSTLDLGLHPAAPFADTLARAFRALGAGRHAATSRLRRPGRRSPRGLHALPDHLLRDLGLTRGDLDRL